VVSDNAHRDGDDSSPVVRTASFDPATEDPIPVISELLGAELEADPAHLFPPIESIIDCDHLASLLADERPRRAQVQASFTYGSYRIVLDSPDRIRLLSADPHST